MDDLHTHLHSIDFDALFSVCRRLVSVETVADVQEFVAKIDEAQKIFVGAALRIVGVDDIADDDARSRNLAGPDADREQQVAQAVAEYRGLSR